MLAKFHRLTNIGGFLTYILQSDHAILVSIDGFFCVYQVHRKLAPDKIARYKGLTNTSNSSLISLTEQSRNSLRKDGVHLINTYKISCHECFT